MRLMTVVLGTQSPESRADATQALLNYGFRFFETHRLYTDGAEITTARVWKGETENVQLGVTDDLFITIPRGQYDSLAAEVDLESELVAPLEKERPVGTVRVSLNGNSLAELPLVVLEDVGEAGFFARLKDEITLWLQ